MLVAVEHGVDILVVRALLGTGVLIGGEKTETRIAQRRRGDALRAAARHQVVTRTGQAGRLQQGAQEVFVDIHGCRAGTGVGRHQLACEENRIDLLARRQDSGHILAQGMQHHGLLLLISPTQSDIGNMKGGKFFHCCKTLSVQRNLTEPHAGTIPGKITRFCSSKSRTC